MQMKPLSTYIKENLDMDLVLGKDKRVDPISLGG